MTMTRRSVRCPHLPDVDAPIEWAVVSDGVLYTSQIPIRADGSLETGDIEAQARLTFENLRLTMEAAGGSMTDVTQVQIFLTNAEDFTAVNDIYAEYFSKPYPNRATVVVAGLLAAGIRIEIIAHGHVDS